MNRSIIKLSAKLSAGWWVLWIPISYLFQQNPHAPIFALFAPFIGFIAALDGAHGSWDIEGNCFKEVTFPWLVFWLVQIILLITARSVVRLRESEQSNGKGN